MHKPTHISELITGALEAITGKHRIYTHLKNMNYIKEIKERFHNTIQSPGFRIIRSEKPKDSTDNETVLYDEDVIKLQASLLKLLNQEANKNLTRVRRLCMIYTKEHLQRPGFPEGNLAEEYHFWLAEEQIRYAKAVKSGDLSKVIKQIIELHVLTYNLVSAFGLADIFPQLMDAWYESELSKLESDGTVKRGPNGEALPGDEYMPANYKELIEKAYK
jgi:hypothetical protein